MIEKDMLWVTLLNLTLEHAYITKHRQIWKIKNKVTN